VEFVDIIPQPHAFSAIVPGLGFLRGHLHHAFLVQWSISAGWATSPQLPKVRFPVRPFMGVSAVRRPRRSSGVDQARAGSTRRGGLLFPPDTAGAVPAVGRRHEGPAHAAAARERRHFDVKQLEPRARSCSCPCR